MNGEKGYIERLVACGFTEANAAAIYCNYVSMSDWDGLETFVRTSELIYDDSVEYPSER